MAILTKEQEAVVIHPIGNHAKILAVAGSGKTSTLVYRIKYLVSDKKMSSSCIQVLMFNRLARQQFNERMVEADIPVALQPKVNTFHSFSYGFMQSLIEVGKFPAGWNYWIDDKEEQARMTVNAAISDLEKSCKIREGSVDPEEAYQAIQLWKGSLIPPDRAGYRGNDFTPLVYEEYERQRMIRHGLTYDDFITIVVSYLENSQDLLQQYARNLQHLIVDEYQDVNYGQQRLIELLAGNRADVMVVGDDDQTIYEWRGARPNYIIRDFQTVFDNKPIIQYSLSHSFRFGAVIAQCAYNSILFNTNRVHKSLVSHSIEKPANIFLYEQSSNQRSDTNKALTDQVIALVRNKGVHPSKIVVLCRMFAQLSGIESEFLARKIPYRIIGQRPFFERREVKVLLDYVRLAICYRNTITERIRSQFLNIANTPNRTIARRDFEGLMGWALIQKTTLAQALEVFEQNPTSPLNNHQRERVLELMAALESANKEVVSYPTKSVDTLLSGLVSSLNYFAHFENYFGKGETSFDRRESVLNFITYAKNKRLPPSEFLVHIESIDTTHGVPEDEQIVMTTVFRTKGLEYDFVFIPDCNEGYMPCLYATGNRVFDKLGKIIEPEPSEAIENERRLFYVALTRAKEAVYIGTGALRGDPQSPKPSRFIDEIQLEPTFKVMTDLQQAAIGKKDAKLNFLSHITQFGGMKSLTQNLLSHYLVALGDVSLIGKVASIVLSSREIPFRYRFAYAPPQGVSNNKAQSKLHSAWDEVDD